MNFGIVTVSDRSSRGERADASGPALAQVVEAQGWRVVRTKVLADEMGPLSEILAGWADSGDCDVILTTGGTGLAPRDVTPEATLAIAERLVPGIPEAMRAASLDATPHAMLSRLAAGIRKQTLIINLPGSPTGAVENLRVVIPVLHHAVELLRGRPGAEAGHAKAD